MRKSSLSNRNSNILTSERRSRGRSTDGSRSSLLQPGFATKHRRSSSSENRDSGADLLQRRSHLPIRRSRSQLTLQPCVTPRRETISPGSSRTTPNDGLKYNRAVIGTAQKTRRDTRNFNDKAVMNAATTQVSNYFSQQGRTLNLRQPLALKTFLESTAFLLDEVGMCVNLTTANYIEEIPYALRYLNYPGSLATSWLKTAYAQLSLPHVVAMLSWLVDLIEHSAITDIFEGSKIDEENGFRILPAKDYFDFFATVHMHWNKFRPEDDVVDEFKNKLAQTFLPDVDENRKTALEIEIESLAAKCQHDEEVMKRKNALEESLQILQSDIAKLKTHLKHSHKFTLTLDNKIESLDTKQGETEGKVIHVQCLTEKLRKQVASQEMSVEDLNELLQTCEHLRGRIRSAEKCISELQEMAYKCDHQIVQTRVKFNEKMEHFNNLLVMESCSIPQLSQLQIRSNVLADTYIEEAEEVDKVLSSLHKNLVAARSETELVLSNIKLQVDELTLSVNSVRQEISCMTENTMQLERRISKLKVTMQENETKMREEEKHLQDEISKYLHNQDVVALKEKLSELQAKQENWEISLKKLKEKASRFFKESVAITESFAAEVSNLRLQKEERLKKLIEQKKSQCSKRP